MVMHQAGNSETVSIASECNFLLLVQYGMMRTITLQICLFDATLDAMVQKFLYSIDK
jgi:hypothetical protein